MSDMVDGFRDLKAVLKQMRQPVEDARIDYAVKKLTRMGFAVRVVSNKAVEFDFMDCVVKFFPYSGWHTGKSIKDGRGWKNLIKQLIKGIPK